MNNKLYGESTTVLDQKIYQSSVQGRYKSDHNLTNCQSVRSQNKRNELPSLLLHYDIEIIFGNESQHFISYHLKSYLPLVKW